MIEFAKSYKASDGKCYGTLQEAQVVEICAILSELHLLNVEEQQKVAEGLVDAKDAVIDILTTTDTSRPKARRINGGSKKRKPAPTVAPVRPQAA